MKYAANVYRFFFFDQIHRKNGSKLSKCIYKPNIACKFLVNSTAVACSNKLNLSSF